MASYALYLDSGPDRYKSYADAVCRPFSVVYPRGMVAAHFYSGPLFGAKAYENIA
jgi:hypothetical protein